MRSLLPDPFQLGHQLCYLQHDAMGQLLAAGEREESFGTHVSIPSGEPPPASLSVDDLFEWFAQTGRTAERARVLRCTVFPAVLADFLHFIYEALAASRKAKLTVCFALLRAEAIAGQSGSPGGHRRRRGGVRRQAGGAAGDHGSEAGGR